MERSEADPLPRDSIDHEFGLLDAASVFLDNLRWLLILPVVAGLVAWGLSYLMRPSYLATTTFMLPAQQQNAASAALASLGALSGLAGSAGVQRNSADQYVALMQSALIQDRLIEKFNLMEVYEAEFRFQARRRLLQNARIDPGKKDGLITVTVEDHDPQRAADLANAHVEELRLLTNNLAITEAQQRRAFFEQQLERSKTRLTMAQQALQSSGFNQGALQTEPRAAAERYARLKAEVTAAEVRLQTLRSYLTESASEYQQQQAALAALRAQLARAEEPAQSQSQSQSGSEYIDRYRDFKYEETLFDLFARQYELARVDESREGALIQVIDVATRPEWKHKPQRAYLIVVSAVAGFILVLLLVLVRKMWAIALAADPEKRDMLKRLRSGFYR